MMDRSYSSGLRNPSLLGSRREETPLSSLLGFRRDAGAKSYLGSTGGGDSGLLSGSNSFGRTDWNSSKADSFYQDSGLGSEYRGFDDEYGSRSRISTATKTDLPGRMSYGQPTRDNEYGSFITEKTSRISSAANTEMPGRMTYRQPVGDDEFNNRNYSTNFEHSFRGTGRPQPQSRFSGDGDPQSEFNNRNTNFPMEQTTPYLSNISSRGKNQQGQRNQGAPKRKNRKQGGNQRQPAGMSMEEFRNKKEQQIKLEMMKMDEIRRQKQQELQQELNMMENIRKRKHEQMEHELMEQELRQRHMMRQSDERDFMEFQEFMMMKRMRRENENRERSLGLLMDGGLPFGGPQPGFNQFQNRPPPLLPHPRSHRGRNASAFGRNLLRPMNQRMGQQPGKKWQSPRGRNKNFPNQSRGNKRGQPKQVVQQQKKKPADTPKQGQQQPKKNKQRPNLRWNVKEEIPEKFWFCGICQVDTESEENHDKHLETTKHTEALDEDTKTTKKKLLNLLREYMNNHNKAKVLEVVKTVQTGAYTDGDTCMEELWKLIQYYCVACRLRFCTSAEFKEHKLTVSHIKQWRARLIKDRSVGVSLTCPDEYNPEVSVGEEQILFFNKRNCLVCDELLSWNDTWSHARNKTHFEHYKALLEKEAGNQDDAKDAEEATDAK